MEYYIMILGGFMFDYNIEYRENILFIRFIGNLKKKDTIKLDSEFENIINNIGISNIVFNFIDLKNIDNYSLEIINKWLKILNNRKGVNFTCGGKFIKDKLYNTIFIDNELSAIKLLNWSN